MANRARDMFKFLVIVGGLIFLVLSFNNCQKTPSRFSNDAPSSNSFDSDGLNGNGGGQSVADNTETIVNSSEARLYFNNTLKPLFTTRCERCHALPLRGGTATVAIYEFEDMAQLLADGDSSTNNKLINTMQNIAPHGAGGNTCPQGALRTPCKEVLEWRQLVIPNSDAGGLGAIRFVSSLGEVSGWAIDPENPDAKLEVRIYYNGESGVGVPAAPITADGNQPSVFYDGHFFEYQLPSNLANGQPQSLYAYAMINGEEVLMPNMPKNFIAYAPKAETFFNSNVRSGLNACANCHSWDYDSALFNLVDPPPDQGGTRTSNRLINAARGLNGHNGGSFCSSANAGVCASLQNWWNAEFQ